MSAFFDLIRQMPIPFNMVVLIVLIVGVSEVVKAVIKQARIYADNEADRRLKREMIEAGCSADEAQRIADLQVTKPYVPTAK